MTAASSKTLRVLVADDHRLMLAAVRRSLERAPELELVGEVNDATKIVPTIAALRPDVLLLDIRMPDLDGLTCLERVRRHHPEVAVVMLSSFSGDEQIETARERGASGFVVKTVDPLELPRMVVDAVRSDEFLVFRPEPEADSRGESLGLSDRELAVLQAVARGLTNREIAAELWLSEQTVKFHLRNVYRKLSLSSRAEAARFVISRGLASAEPASASHG